MKSSISLRSGKPDDAAASAEICYQAFRAINTRHGFEPDIPSVAMAQGFITELLKNPHVFSIVAEENGRIVGSNFLWDGAIGGIGPITVDASAQNAGVGKALMIRALEIADEKKMPGTRLVQAAFHNRSLSLYTKLGFDVREPLACMQGKPPGEKFSGRQVRKMTRADIPACNEVCIRVHGHDRRGELPFAISQGTALVVQSDDRITGYATDIGFFAHALALENSDLLALISAAEKFSGPGFLLPTCNSEVFRWCLDHGLRVTQPMNLMSRGLYNEPKGAFLPSILF